MRPDELQRGRELAAEAHKLGFIGGSTLSACQQFFELDTKASLNVDQFFLKLADLDRLQLALIQRDWSILNRLEAFNDRLRLIREISRGGMGVVYQAWDSVLERIVAVKEVLPSRLAGGGTILLRFENEARAMASIKHSSVVGIYDAGISPRGTPYMVIDYVPGCSLGHLIARLKDGWTVEQALKPARVGPGGVPLEPGSEPVLLDVEQVARWGKDLAEGLHACHQKNVLHRDVKPGNVLVSERGEVKLTDFGIALDTYAERVTKTGVAVGTPLYMPPEHLFGKKSDETIGPTTDVYSLGATLFEALAGQPPFHAKSVRELYVQIFSGEPTRLQDLREDVPEALEAVLLKCLSRTPEERYPTAQALAEDLSRFLLGAPVLALPEAEPVKQTPAIGSRLTAALTGAVVLLVVVLLILLWNSRT